MDDILVGDRVIVSNLIGTVREKAQNHLVNEQKFVKNTKTGTNGLFNNGNLRENHTFVIEWDDMTKGEFQGNSYRLKKGKEFKFNILRYFNNMMGDKLYDSKVFEIINNKLYNIDSCRPHSLVSYEHISKGSSFELEFNNKYLSNSDKIETIEMEGSYRTYEFVGMDKAVNFFSNTNNLYTVSLNECKISKIGNIGKFPRCSELYLTNNLLNSSEINKIFEYFPKLEILDVSGNLIDKSLESSRLNVLIMNRSFINFKTILETLNRSPNLSTLVLTDNYIEDVEFIGRSYRSMRSIDLSNNLIYRWSTVFTLFKLFPNLEKIVIENNFISKLHLNSEFDFERNNMIFPKLVDLDLSGNLINSLGTLVNLSHIFPNITRLKIMYNPFDFNNPHDLESEEENRNNLTNGIEVENNENTYNNHNSNICSNNSSSINNNNNNINNKCTFNNVNDTNNSNNNFLKILNNVSIANDQLKDNLNEILRMFVVVTFPNLTILNGTSVTAQERVNSERYLNYLEIKTNPENREGSRNQVNIFNNNKIKVLLIPDGDSDSFLIDPIEKRLPETCTVFDLKLLCSKLFKIDLKDIRLIYNNKKMPLSEELDDDSAELGRYGISDGYEIRAQSKKIKL